MVRPNHVYGRNLGAAITTRSTTSLEETGLVLSVHEGLGVLGGRRSGVT